MRDFCFSLQTVLATKGVIYFSAWSLYLSIPSSLCFVHICEVTEAREFPCCTSGSPSLTFTLLLLKEEGTSRDKRGSHSRSFNWRFLLISHIFNCEHEVHIQLLHVALLTFLFLLSTHEGFFPNPSSFQIFGLCPTTAILDPVRDSQGCSASLC